MAFPDNSVILQENSDTLIVVPVFAESSVIADVVTELAKAKGQSLWNSVNLLFDLILR